MSNQFLTGFYLKIRFLQSCTTLAAFQANQEILVYAMHVQKHATFCLRQQVILSILLLLTYTLRISWNKVNEFVYTIFFILLLMGAIFLSYVRGPNVSFVLIGVFVRNYKKLFSTQYLPHIFAKAKPYRKQEKTNNILILDFQKILQIHLRLLRQKTFSNESIEYSRLQDHLNKLYSDTSRKLGTCLRKRDVISAQKSYCTSGPKYIICG